MSMEGVQIMDAICRNESLLSISPSKVSTPVTRPPSINTTRSASRTVDSRWATREDGVGAPQFLERAHQILFGQIVESRKSPRRRSAPEAGR